MFICSTVLYFGDDPVGYDLYKTTAGFELKPTPATSSKIIPPRISVQQMTDGWQVAMQDEDIRQQVLKLVEMNQALSLPGELSAAS
jgi:hypothetical protein